MLRRKKFAVCLLVFIGVVFINTFSAKADVYAGNSNSKLELISQIQSLSDPSELMPLEEKNYFIKRGLQKDLRPVKKKL